MEKETVRDFYDSSVVVEYYRRAAASIGLWISEDKVFTQCFKPDQVLLEVGCGTGRISLGMAELGYKHIMGVDIARVMIKEARKLNQLLGAGVSFQVGDATALKFDDGAFEGAIFGFNGLMQIPKSENRLKAMREIYRVLQPGSYFVFTTHDRENPKRRSYWQQEQKRWNSGKQNPSLDEYGDRYEDTDLGMLFIHIPTREEVRDALNEVGFKVEMDILRSQLSKEPLDVREFSDECRFWIARKPLSD